MPGEINIYTCDCNPAPGTTPPDVANYVVSIEGLFGIVELNGTGVLDISTSGNTINFGLAAGAGLGTVTSVAASSSNSNLVVAGSPITTFGTLAFSLAGALNSISGLVTAADKMIYTTASDTYAVTDLSAFARTLLDDAAAVNARSTLGLVIGTNVQAWNADLDSFVTVATFAGTALTLSGALTVTGDTTFNGTTTIVSGDLEIVGTTTGETIIAATGFSGPGSSITNLNVSNAASGTLLAVRGGTGNVIYAVGDLLSANTTTTLSRVASVAAGSYLRSAGVSTLPVWSTLTLPNAGTTGDVFIATSTNTMGRVTGVATGNVFLSGGVGVIPAWGKVTTSHTTGIAASGTNADITTMSALNTVSSQVAFSNVVSFAADVQDSTSSAGGDGYLFTALGSGGTAWSNQITMDTLTLNTRLSIEGTITAGGTTGAQTINKPSGTVNFAAAATSVVVTNSLCTASDRVLATVVTNDTTMKSVSCVTTSGAFTLTANAAATAETAVYWVLIRVS